MPTLLQNKKAYFDYEILDTFTAGMSLDGVSVKQIRSKQIKLDGLYIIYQQKQLQIIGLGDGISSSNIPLLLNDKELQKILKQLQTKGLTCIPVKIFTSKRWLKVEIAVVRGKKNYDKKEYLKQKDLDREMARDLK
jgi:SsrA-binding protein